MELLVYALNVCDPGATEPRREAGAMVGEPSDALIGSGTACSFVEVRLPLRVVDPTTEIQLIIAKAFASWGHPGGGRVLRYECSRGSVALLLEPGFERARDLCRALHPVLPQARLLLERARPRAPSVPRPSASGQPSPLPLSMSRSGVPRAVMPDGDQVVPVRVFGRPTGSRLAVPRFDR
ncbi:MAG: hypothetical protein AB1Z98_06660 [Nannocystaceae bacterium]